IKARPGRYASTLHGKFIALIFEKPSLRTRVTFDVGIQSMGGAVVFLDHTQASASLGKRESIADVARNLDRWVHGIVARVYSQKVLEEMAANASIPVINALSDKFHPCQALADFFTLEAVSGAMAVYTDAWTSMGFEAEEEVRTKIFEPYQVNSELMSLAAPEAVFMHCLPAHRGLEVTPEVLDGPQSVVLDQSENRMYVQK